LLEQRGIKEREKEQEINPQNEESLSRSSQRGTVLEQSLGGKGKKRYRPGKKRRKNYTGTREAAELGAGKRPLQ
jgi:hypothetical protein